MSDNRVIMCLMNLFDQVRRAVRADVRSVNRLAADAGMSQSALQLFATGDRGLSVETLERLAGVLGFEVALKRKRRAPRPRKD